MTQPEALRIAAAFERFAADHAPNGWPAIQQRELTNAAITLRAQHAEIERKDALLRQALEAINNAVLPLTANDEAMLDAAFQAITEELQ